MTPEEYRMVAYKQRILPSQLERARRRVEQLEREARRYGMAELAAERQA